MEQQQHHHSLGARPHGSWDRWLWPGRRFAHVWGQETECAEEEEREEAAGVRAACPSANAVTGLSQPRGKVARQQGAINVRPSPSAVVMADKRLSGSSHSQPTPDTRARLCYALSEGEDTNTNSRNPAGQPPLILQPSPDSHSHIQQFKHEGTFFHRKEQKNTNIFKCYIKSML